jgi:uncharacterized protein YhhL (DUF1145 family)
MTSEVEKDLAERVRLIENMMAEGRRKTESWGWTFLLWGVAYYVATAWATWGRASLAWPVTMIAAAVITGVVASRMSHGQPETTLGRALTAIWASMGVSIFVLLMSLAYSGRYDMHVFVAIIGAMLGLANAASAIILKWRMQLACAVVWLASAVIACFGSDIVASIDFLAATFVGMIVFGIYAMICESRRRRQSGVVHA